MADGGYSLALRRRDVAALCLLAGLGVAALACRAAWRRDAAGGADAPHPARVAAARETIDPNTATVASLRRLPGIGPAKAHAIVAWRQAHGPRVFVVSGDLAAVRGIGPGIVRNIGPYLALSAGSR